MTRNTVHRVNNDFVLFLPQKRLSPLSIGCFEHFVVTYLVLKIRAEIDYIAEKNIVKRVSITLIR